MASKFKLRVQSNRMIVLEETGAGFVHTSAARDIAYHVEWKYPDGWQSVVVYDDPRDAIADVTTETRWKSRLVAVNGYGRVTLPRNWHPYRG